MRQRLQKIIATAGIASRRAAERLILEGRVQVDGEVVRTLGVSADPGSADIRVDGTRVRVRGARKYLALHKPKGYVTTRSDPGRRRTVMDLLPQSYRRLYPVGRLDMATSGLLVLTDDGELAQLLGHPRHGVPKTYLVTVNGTPDRRVLDRAKRGLHVQAERLRLDEVQLLSRRDPDARTSRLRVTLREGRYREIRRLFEALGFPVVALHRERIGQLSVRGIPPGGFRPLSRAEVDRLRREAEH